MSFDLTDARADLDALLATAVDAATWTNALKDEALRAALAAYGTSGPVYESTVTLAAGGAEQDLAALLPGLLTVEALAWPWSDGAPFAAQVAAWRPTGAPGCVRFEEGGGIPAAGEAARVRYRMTHTLDGLDGADATSVPDAHRRTLAAGAAEAACALRLRQIGENPAIPAEAAAALEAARARYARSFAEGLALLVARGPRPAWPGIGL
jgi:hypothetical protein